MGGEPRGEPAGATGVRGSYGGDQDGHGNNWLWNLVFGFFGGFGRREVFAARSRSGYTTAGAWYP